MPKKSGVPLWLEKFSRNPALVRSLLLNRDGDNTLL
jgi:hypothetical protein